MKSLRQIGLFALLPVLLAGCALFGKKEPPATLELYEQASPALPAHLQRTFTIPKTGLAITAHRFPALTDQQLHRAELKETPGGSAIVLRFAPKAMFKLSELTARMRGQYLVTVLDGKPVAAWLVDQRLDLGQITIEGDFTDEQARKAVESFNKEAIKREKR